MDAAVRDEALDRLARDLAAERVEAREDDRARRVVHDELDAGRELERADVASLASDDASLHVVAREIDDGHGRLDRVLGGAALDGVGDDLLRARAGHLARLGFDALDEVGGVPARVRFDLFEEELFRLVVGQARHALELALALGRELLGARDRRFRGFLAIGDIARSRPRSSWSSLSVAVIRSESARVLSTSVCSRVEISCRRARASRSAPAASSWAFSLASRRVSFFFASASRSASRRTLSACSSARPMVSAAIRFRLATHQAKTARRRAG